MRLIIIYIVFLIILLVQYLYVPIQPNFDLILYCLILVLLLTFLFFKKKDRLFKQQFFRHSYFIVFGYLIVHFQYYTDLIFDNSDLSNKFIWVNSEVLNKTIILSTVGIICFFIGYLSFKKRIKSGKQWINENIQHTTYLKILAFIFLLLYFYWANPLYFFGNNGIIELGSAASYVIVLFEVCTLAILIQNVRNLKNKGEFNLTFIKYLFSHGLLMNSLISVYLLSVMLSGDRGPLLLFTLAIASNYLYLTGHKLNFLRVSIFIFLGAIVLTTLGNIRAISGNKSFSEKVLAVFKSKTENRFGEVSFLPPTQNLATSIRSLHHAIDFVPDHHDYLYGRFQFQQITSTVPYFSNFNQLIFSNNHWKYNGSANFISWKNQGEFPYTGDGTTVVADFYLDFGVYGVILGMFLIGYITRYSELLMYHASNCSYFQHAFFLVLLCFSFYLSRSSAMILLKSILWTYFFLILNKKVFNRN
jgi:hypothetical protein